MVLQKNGEYFEFSSTGWSQLNAGLLFIFRLKTYISKVSPQYVGAYMRSNSTEVEEKQDFLK